MSANLSALQPPLAQPLPKQRLSVDARFVPLIATIGLFGLLVVFGSLRYDGFFSAQVFMNLLIDNAFLCIVAVGMTFVILTGGIDLSVGSVVALTTMLCAWLLEKHHWPAHVVIPFVLVLGSLFGGAMGLLIQACRLQPFIVTLAGMFLARGLCYLISIDSVNISNEVFTQAAAARIPVWGDASLSLSALIALATIALAVFIAHFTQFGRTVYAIGGNEHSAVLMGLRVRSTLIATYALSGLCSTLAGVVFSFYMLSGYGLHAVGLELDAIAAVVVGGTLLTGGVGYVFGTLFGVLTLGIIQTLIMFEGTLSSWWTRIAIGVLLLIFCLLQRVFHVGASRRSG